MATIGEGLKYPFKNFARLFNVWWMLVPIWGWFVVMGYFVRVIQEVVKGKDKEAPAIRPFDGLFKTGFFYFIVALVIGIVTAVLMMIPILGWLVYIYVVLVAPMLMLQFAEKGSIADGLNVMRASKTMFANFGDWIITWLKVLVSVLIWAIASIPIITIIVTGPASYFTQYYLFAEFYKNAKKAK